MYALFKNNKIKYFGQFLGFFLSIGIFLGQWIIDYAKIKIKVNSLCNIGDNGLIVYVTPEQYRKKIGNSEWNNLKFNINAGDNYKTFYYDEFKNYTVKFENIDYKFAKRVNRRIILLKGYIDYNYGSFIYFDVVDKTVLVKRYFVKVPRAVVTGGWTSANILRDTIKGCEKITYDQNKILKKYSNN